MKTTQNIAKRLSILCLIGLVGIMLNLHVCSIKKAVFNASTNTTIDSNASKMPAAPGFSAEENIGCSEAADDQQGSASALPADLGVTRMLAPIISQYLAEYLPRLVQ